MRGELRVSLYSYLDAELRKSENYLALKRSNWAFEQYLAVFSVFLVISGLDSAFES